MLPSPADGLIIQLGKSSRDATTSEDDDERGGGRRGGAGARPSSPGGCQQPVTRKMFWHPKDIEFVQELVPEQVRWLYREDPKGVWIPFVGYDSLRIECCYRALQLDPDMDKCVKVRGGLYEADLVGLKCRPMYWKGVEFEIMRGTWFEMPTLKPVPSEHAAKLEADHLSHFRGARILTSILLHDSPGATVSHTSVLAVVPGAVTVDGCGSAASDGTAGIGSEASTGAAAPGVGAAAATASVGAAAAASVAPAVSPPPVAKKAIHHLQFENFHVEWYSPCDIYQYSESRSSRVMRTFTHTLGMQKHGMGTRLVRGYGKEAQMEDREPDVSHLVFVVHGIGQKRNQNRIVTCTDELRANVKRLVEQSYPDLVDSPRRVEFLPVEWRSKLVLDGDSVESVTPEKLKSFRTLLNSTAMDILYYTSPLYRSEIVAALETELNRLYGLFCENHPYFDANNGKVSIVAHSLGCVIMYDILTGWDPIMLYDQYVSNAVKEASAAGCEPPENADLLNSQERSKRLHDFYLKSIRDRQQTSLKFQVTNFFCLGSPLAVFLSLRGVRPQTNGLMDHILPKSLCTRLFNVYHATDPVAYRLEPLVLKHYSTVTPLKVHRADAVNKTPYGSMTPRAYAALQSKASGKTTRTQKRSAEDAGRLRSAASGASAASEQEASFGGTASFTDVSLDEKLLSRGVSTVAATSQEVHSADFLSSSPPLATDGGSAAGTPTGTARASAGGSFAGVVRHLIGRIRLGGKKEEEIVEERLAAEMVNCEDSGEESPAVDDAWDSLSREDSIEHTDLEHRLDYVLPSTRLYGGYWGAIFSHTAYWSSPEVALFILSNIFPECQFS